eukprot:925313-Amphidinium_carterae.1
MLRTHENVPAKQASSHLDTISGCPRRPFAHIASVTSGLYGHFMRWEFTESIYFPVPKRLPYMFGYWSPSRIPVRDIVQLIFHWFPRVLIWIFHTPSRIRWSLPGRP